MVSLKEIPTRVDASSRAPRWMHSVSASSGLAHDEGTSARSASRTTHDGNW